MSAATKRQSDSIGIALSFPGENDCEGQTPTEGSFVSKYTARIVSDRLSSLYRLPLSINNEYMRSNFSDVFFDSDSVFDGSTSSTRIPYSYINVENLLGIQKPFFCGENNRTREFVVNSTEPGNTPTLLPDNFKFSLGGHIRDLHSCPMSVSEWDAILPDVVIDGVNVDQLIGINNMTASQNNVTSILLSSPYDQIEQSGQWHIPKNSQSGPNLIMTG